MIRAQAGSRNKRVQRMVSRPEPAAAAVTPLHPEASDSAGLAALLRYEGEVRKQASVDELTYFVANESRALVAYDQMFVLRRSAVRSGLAVTAASSLARIDNNAPLIQAIERAAAGFGDDVRRLADRLGSDDPALSDYPFTTWQWAPLNGRDGIAYGGLLLARAAPWSDADALRLTRMTETIGHSWLALTGGKPPRRRINLDRRAKRWIAGVLIVGALFPVRMTALAPVEVVAAQPFIVSAPYSGVIARVEVAPNAMVRAGQPVLTFEDIKVRNELGQAEERVAVARAKLDRSTSAAFGDPEQAREIAPLRAELELAQTDLAYARDMMGKAQITAQRAGMAIYSDRRDWEGRAVNVGDPILHIADPREIAYRIDLPAKEQMRLEPGAPVKVWLDAQPLWALDGRVETASYLARPTADNILAFAVTAKPAGGNPRIGSRGTAKLYGQRAPFIYTVLRRPIASARQFLGL
jgi:multidrug resistance efflux pump